MEVLPWIWICSPSNMPKFVDTDNIKIAWIFSQTSPLGLLPNGIKKVRIKYEMKSKEWIPIAREMFKKNQGQILFWDNKMSYEKMLVFMEKFIIKNSSIDEVKALEYLKLFV